MKFWKKPAVIEAIQWTGNNVAEVMGFASAGLVVADYGTLKIPTLEGEMTASLGDWVIRGVKGELYPCKPDIFAATYEAVDLNDEVRRAFDDYRNRR